MSSVAARPAPKTRVRLRIDDVRVTAVLLLGLVGLSLLLRTRALRAGFWIDEGLSAGIASHSLSEIPSVLELDGSPPLYYLALHLWMQVFGPGEGATHGLSIGFALLCVPLAFLGGRLLGGVRAGWFAAILVALHPFLTYYAQETRMYALAALLSLAFALAFARAFAFRDRRWLPVVAVAGAAVAYTHNWGLFLLAGSAAGIALCWRGAEDRRALGRDVALAYGAMALLYLPWLPTLLAQAGSTGAPWATRPGFEALSDAVVAALGGWRATPLILIVGGAGLAALMGRPVPVPGAPVPAAPDDRRRLAVESLLALLVVGLLVAWLASQISPAWASRYLAVFLGPAILLAGLGLAHARVLGIAALVFLSWLWWDGREAALETKSNVREVSARIALRPVGPGDLVVSTHPEQIPVLRYYLGEDFRYADALGPVADPRVFDWRDALDRLQATRPTPTADALIRTLEPGQAFILVMPLLRSYTWGAPWTRLVKRRTIQWERVLERDPRLRRVEVLPKFGLRFPPRGVRAVIYRVNEGPAARRAPAADR
jgi:mannosyltransferase